MKTNLTAYILAGGKSSRMGRDKGLIVINNKPMIQYLIDTLKTIGIETIIVTNNESYVQFDLKIISDLIPNKGPIGGIYTALTHSKTEYNLILSCDTPFINQQLIDLLIQNHKTFDITTVSYNHKHHPLIGIYNALTSTTFLESINSNKLKLTLVNERLNQQIIKTNSSQFEDEIFLNINTQNDLKNIQL